MRSSSGAHYIALDHIRAFAAFLVVTWHFTHGKYGNPVHFNYLPAVFPLSILDEGHTGVALFMTLSGYLFAKLLDGKSINYKAFIWNRFLRLMPLMTVVILIVGIKDYLRGQNVLGYLHSIARGIVYPTLPNGGWSITVEFHYYLILPLLLWLLSKSRFWPFSLIVASIAFRTFWFWKTGEIQALAYHMIIGRFDQFALGMLVFHFRSYFARKHLLAISTILGFTAFYWYFDFLGGYYNYPAYPSPSPLWIFLPTIEGIAYAVGIAWYDNSFRPSTTGFSKFIGRLGEYSYSIYLLHMFIVFRVAQFVNKRIMNISNFYLAVLWAMAFFVFMFIPGYLSFHFIELPFLKLRKPYVKSVAGAKAAVALGKS